MKIEAQTINDRQLAEVISESVLITTPQEALDLLADLYYQGFDGIMIYERNITPTFFDLSSGLAGEILQKFSNYKIKLAIIGEFSAYQGKSLKDFIYESNKLGNVNFVNSLEEAQIRLSRK
ncbi:MAG: DUF4180 domain-containing protein [Sporocytophaga sp.]|uniref:DUF4180 domain-containing protein n=1 Tax=Sporocytophaga sp. TaxID=2231183 RepID=UPI001B2E339B|nr:DUF4180 domain-containing protein [Sporocytophaga sp.]MBO9703119.1 DUF4180 domain-containing protein [Sporocytophaga sp.]